MPIVTGCQLDLVLMIRTQCVWESNWVSIPFIHLLSLCLTDFAIVVLQDTVEGFANIKVNIVFCSHFVCWASHVITKGI